MRVALRTDLPVDECVRRLSASGWAGGAKPDRWQPAATDRDMFRRIDGHRFWLATRDVHLGPASVRALGLRFHGRLTPHGQSTRITGDDGRRPGRPFLLLGILVGGALLLQLAGVSVGNPARAPQGNAAPSEVLLRTGLSAVVVYALLAAVLFALVQVVARLSPEPPNARFVEFLARTLEARPPTE